MILKEAKNMEHPDITKVNQMGYVDTERIYGIDFFGSEVYYGDEIYIHDEEFWLVDDLEIGEKALLEHFGAKKIIAKDEL